MGSLTWTAAAWPSKVRPNFLNMARNPNTCNPRLSLVLASAASCSSHILLPRASPITFVGDIVVGPGLNSTSLALSTYSLGNIYAYGVDTKRLTIATSG